MQPAWGKHPAEFREECKRDGGGRMQVFEISSAVGFLAASVLSARVVNGRGVEITKWLDLRLTRLCELRFRGDMESFNFEVSKRTKGRLDAGYLKFKWGQELVTGTKICSSLNGLFRLCSPQRTHDINTQALDVSESWQIRHYQQCRYADILHVLLLPVPPFFSLSVFNQHPVLTEPNFSLCHHFITSIWVSNLSRHRLRPAERLPPAVSDADMGIHRFPLNWADSCGQLYHSNRKTRQHTHLLWIMQSSRYFMSRKEWHYWNPWHSRPEFSRPSRCRRIFVARIKSSPFFECPPITKLNRHHFNGKIVTFGTKMRNTGMQLFLDEQQHLPNLWSKDMSLPTGIKRSKRKKPSRCHHYAMSP